MQDSHCETDLAPDPAILSLYAYSKQVPNPGIPADLAHPGSSSTAAKGPEEQT